jgi:hypothetical protein
LTTLTFYTQINYDAQIKDGEFSTPQGFSVIKSPRDMQKFSKREISKAVSFNVVEPKYVPAGYVLDGFYLFHHPRRGKAVHIRYIDGLNNVSVIEFLRPMEGHARGRMRGFGGGHQGGRGWRGGAKCELLDDYQGRIIRMPKGDLNLIFIGDIAENELRNMADSL